MLQWMPHLKKLNISHTKANLQVFQVIEKHCRQLEYLVADNCPGIYDECLDILISKLSTKILEISMDNVRLTKPSIVRALLTCQRLKHFNANGLLDILTELLQSVDKTRTLQLTKCLIESDILLSDIKMDALAHLAPDLRQLNINCIGPNTSLAYLGQFRALSHLLLANTASLISFRFGTDFLATLRETSLGRQLKYLDLIHLVDVNLRSIAKHCPNLLKLNVEFLGYYEPAFDISLTEKDNLPTIR